jgi:Na+/citrate or Na+/malate symporter
MGENKGINFKVCGLSFKYFVPFFIVVMACTYLGFMPVVKVYSNDAGSYVATSFVQTIAFLMAVGGIFFWLGNTIPIVNNYLGGACLLPLIGASFLNFVGLVPQELVNGVKVLMSGGFQDAYIAMLLVGSILVMDRKVLLGATARYLPAILGSQVFALGACMLAGVITGYGASDALFLIGAPCMSGGSGGAITTLPALYSNLSGTDMTPMAGQFLCYASIANVIAVVLAAIGGAVTAKVPGLNGNGDILRAKGATMVTEGEKRPVTSTDYAALGSGIFMSFCLYLLGNIFGNLPGLSVIPGLAWTIIFGIIIKCSGLIKDDVAYNCVYSMQFALKALLPMLIAGIGINSLKFNTLAEFFTPGAFIVIFIGVLGAFIGAIIFGHIAGLYGYETGVTAGLCCCNIGGSGDLAVLSAANRMNLLAFASISTRIGGALMVIWIGLLYPLFH